MKKLICFAASLVLFLPFAFGTESDYSDYYSSSYARLSYVNGDVYVQRGQDLGYDAAVVNLPLVEGDQLGTREGRTEVQLGKGNYIRIDHNTLVDFSTLPKRGDDLISLNLLNGNIYVRVGSLEFEKGIEIHTPDASFYVLNSGLYRIEVYEQQETRLYVIEGEIEAAGEEGSVAVRRGENLIAENGLFRFKDSGSAVYAESFAEWNRTREGFTNRRVSRRYLPAELYDYEAELDYYGRWVYEASYGYVWVPHVVHTSWQPYRYGRWVWYPIIGWTWVSYNPWGWCVSHYGRWHWRLGLGWYWIPRRAWRPAWVYWHSSYNHIGWCPLSYYGHPVVIINNHFYGRYYSQNYPVHSRALTMIHRNQLQARNISKVALSQKSVTRIGKISLARQQPAVKFRADRTSMTALKAKGVLNRTQHRSISKKYVSGVSGSSLKRAVPSSRKTDAISIDGTSRRISKDAAVRSRTGTGNSSVIDRSKVSFRSGSGISVKEDTNSRIKKYSSRSSSGNRDMPVKVDSRRAWPMIQKYPSQRSSSRSTSSESRKIRVERSPARSPSSSDRTRTENSYRSSRRSDSPVKIDSRSARPMIQKYPSRSRTPKSSSRTDRYSSSTSRRSPVSTQKATSRRSSSPVKRFTSRISVPSRSSSRSKSQARSSSSNYTSRSSVGRSPARSTSSSRSRIATSRSSSRSRSTASRARSSSPSRSSRSAVRSSSSRSRSSASRSTARRSSSSSRSRSRSRKR